MEEKVKMVALKETDWHYRLIKWFWGSLLPDPKKMKNLCPYFWVLVGTLIVLLPVLPFKLIVGFFKFMGKYFNKRQVSKFRKWLKSLSVVEAYDLYDRSGNDIEIIKRPKFARDNYYDNDILRDWAEYQGLDPADPEYHKKLKELFESVKKERRELMEKQRAWREERQKRNWERQKRREARDEKIRSTMDKISEIFKPLAKAGNSVRDKFRIEDYNQIVKGTKRFIGALVTLVIAGALVFVGQLATWGVLSLIEIWSWAAIWYWTYHVLGVVVALVILTAIIYGIWLLIKRAVEYHKDNDRIVWFAIPLVYLSLGLFYVIKYVVYWPGYFIFISFLWKLVCVSFFWGILKGLGRGFAKFGGIFGEYFGASYTDYCPGIEWDDE